MSTYKNLIGKDVNFLSTDPDNTQAEGQIWYNSTSGVFKDLIVVKHGHLVESMIVGRRYFAGCGTQTAGLAFGGNHTGSDTDNNTEEYNGSGWANGGNLTTGRSIFSGMWNSNCRFSVWRWNSSQPSYSSNYRRIQWQ